MNLTGDSLVLIDKIFTALGAAIMLVAILTTRRTLRQTKEDRSYGQWKMLMALMVFFLVGYMVSWYIISYSTARAFFALTGIIFLFGAVFVYISARTSNKTIRELKLTINKAEKAIAQQLLLETELNNSRDQLKDQNDVLVGLAKTIFDKNNTLELSLQQIARKAAEIIDAERVSIWLFNDDKTAIKCIELYIKSRKKHCSGEMLYAKDYPDYFDAVMSDRLIDAFDALKDPRTAGLADYLNKRHITSMLDAPIRIAGELKGVICNEDINEIRNWTVQEQAFASSLADMISMVIETFKLKKTETELEDSLSLVTATLESTADGILVVDNEGKIRGYNQQFVKMWGIPDDILKSMDDSKALGFVLDQLANPDAFINKVKSLYDNQHQESYDVLEFKDGRIFERFSKPQMTRNQITGRVWSFRDVTETKRSELEIMKLNAELETRVQQRTQQVNYLNDELKHKVEDLETANKDLESFSYSVSHDLRAPLRAIIGFLNIWERKTKNSIDPEGKKYMDIVENNAVKMGRLIDDLLAFSRLGKKELKTGKVDVQELVNAVVADIDVAQWNANSKIVVTELLPVVAERNLLYQVFFNLITNALKYSSKKENPVIEIASYRKDNENVYYVKDNGAGFDMAYYDKLFKVFQRMHSAQEYEGTGIGLAIVHRIIIKHGGRVWAEGKENEGATFYFSLPNAPVSENITSAAEAEVLKTATETKPGPETTTPPTVVLRDPA